MRVNNGGGEAFCGGFPSGKLLRPSDPTVIRTKREKNEDHPVVGKVPMRKGLEFCEHSFRFRMKKVSYRWFEWFAEFKVLSPSAKSIESYCRLLRNFGNE